MGANHPGEIAMLCRIAQPGSGLITNIGKAHLEGFGTIQGVAKAKGELFSYLIEHGGTLFVNQDQKLIREQVPGDYPHQFAYNNKEVWAEVLTADPLLQLRLYDSGRDYFLESQLTGAYNLENIVAAWMVGKHFGVPAEKMVPAISAYVPSNNRSQFIITRFNEIILDAYNANPSSMQVAIENLAVHNHQAKLAILGEMLELGAASAREHKNILDLLNKDSVHEVICIGANFKNAAREKEFEWFPDVASLNEYLLKNPVKGKLILVKGSRGNQLEKILEVL
jgi:UDP-N-acetylmuramoyl-tripeptide--D-alanyl-D-alanine ligase